MVDEPDRGLLARFVHGDREAFEAVFRRFEREVYRWILRIVREPAAAEDALIETFWRAYRSRARFDPSRSCGAWLRRIATNAAIDQMKQGVEAPGWPGLPGARRAPDGVTDARDHATSDSIARAFESLPPKLRVVATLALIEEQPQAEIADALGVPIGTVKSRLHRATQQLRKELARLGVHA